MSRVWLVTGSASGLGRHIAEAILASGDRLVATARNVSRLDDLIERYGDRVRPVVLDVTDGAAAISAVRVAVDQFGRLDAVVNNAGFGQIAPFEQIADEDFRALMETCFFGVVNMTRAALPVMRKQRSGTIIQVSSVGGRMGTPGSSSYHAAKWAVSGFTESVAKEVAPFGVKVCAIEPGGMRTDYGSRATKNIPALIPEYEASVGAFAKWYSAYAGKEAGDPDRVAQVVLRLVDSASLPAHLVLGSDALTGVGQVEAGRAEDAMRWRRMSQSIDMDAKEPVPHSPGAERV